MYDYQQDIIINTTRLGLNVFRLNEKTLEISGYSNLEKNRITRWCKRHREYTISYAKSSNTICILPDSSVTTDLNIISFNERFFYINGSESKIDQLISYLTTISIRQYEIFITGISLYELLQICNNSNYRIVSDIDINNKIWYIVNVDSDLIYYELCLRANIR